MTVSLLQYPYTLPNLDPITLFTPILESWVEISSQPSSSSLSSIGDEVGTTGLGVGQPSAWSRQRRQLNSTRRQGAAAVTAYSSQEEFDDDTGSEDDNFMTSSGEKLSVPTTPSRQVIHPDTETDENENATALSRRVPDSPPAFRPQPNAFSHPPVPPASPPNHPHSAVRGGPGGVLNPPRRRSEGPSFMGTPEGANQPDNDAALRASLTTLLSCAAAARGMSKDGKEAPDVLPVSCRPGSRITPSSQPMELRLVQEAELLPHAPANITHATTTNTTTASHRTISRRSLSAERSTKWRSAIGTSGSTKPAAHRTTSRRKRISTAGGGTLGTTTSSSPPEEVLFNPTLMTWVISAGVVVLVSVVGFGAGYVIGREVGKHESINSVTTGLNASSSSAIGCGREVMRGSGGTLRRFPAGIAKSVVAS